MKITTFIIIAIAAFLLSILAGWYLASKSNPQHNIKAIQYVNAYDYQLDVSSVPDSIIIMDGNRWVGIIPMWSSNSPLDSVLRIDNE